MIVAEQLLSQKDIIPNSPTRDKSSLSWGYDRRENALQSVSNDFGNTLISCITARYWPEIPHGCRVLNLRDKGNGRSVSRFEETASSKERFHCS